MGFNKLSLFYTMPESMNFISAATMRRINWDANACRGVSLSLKEKLADYLDRGLNPSSIHQSGQEARALIEEARGQILSMVGNSRSARVVFTSGATEANNAICLSPLWKHLQAGRGSVTGHILTSQVEHPSILEPLKRLEQAGFEVTYLAPDQISHCADFVKPATQLVSMMAANNETGHIYRVADQFAKIKEAYPEVVIHTDAVQLSGKVNFKFDELNADIITLSGHKLGSLPGVGALVMNKHLQIQSLLLGGAQELRYRAGTENVVGIVSFGLAAVEMTLKSLKLSESLMQQREFLRLEISRRLPTCRILFAEHELLPNTLSLHFPGIVADDLVVALDLKGISSSSGSACASGKPLPSHVLRAYGFSETEAREVLRLSLTGEDSMTELEQAVNDLSDCVNRLYLENRVVSERAA